MISTTQNRIQSKTTDRWGEFFANYNITLSKDNKFIIPHDHPAFDEIMYQIGDELDYDVSDDAMIIDMNVRESRLKREEVIWLLKECGMEEPMEAPCGAEEGEHHEHAHSDDSALTISGEPDHEIAMAQKQLRRTADYAGQLQAAFDEMPETNLPAWVQAKITTASDYMDKVYHYLEEYMSQLAYGKGMNDAEEMANGLLQGEITAVHEASEVVPRNNIEIALNITKSDMKKLHEGGNITLKDSAGVDVFTVKVTAS